MCFKFFLFIIFKLSDTQTQYFTTHQHSAMSCVMENKHVWTEEHKADKASYGKLQASTFTGSVCSLLITDWLNK